MKKVGPYRLELRQGGTHFEAVARAILFQQLSGRAAETIHGRYHNLYGGRSPTVDELLGTPDEQLRSVGLSRGKLAYLKDLAGCVKAGTLAIDTLHHLEDQAVIDALTSVKGVGLWTAQMFLMFRLGRPDVLPDTDLGIRKGVQLAYGLPSLPTPKEVQSIGARWRPYASVASWYLWRSLDGDAAL